MSRIQDGIFNFQESGIIPANANLNYFDFSNSGEIIFNAFPLVLNILSKNINAQNFIIYGFTINISNNQMFSKGKLTCDIAIDRVNDAYYSALNAPFGNEQNASDILIRGQKKNTIDINLNLFDNMNFLEYYTRILGVKW